MRKLLSLAIATSLGLCVNSVNAASVKVDINLDIKHEVKGVSDFNREKHITVHSNLTEGDWKGEEDVMNYLMNDLDVYFGRDNGMASWIFKATAQDPVNLGKPDLNDMANFGQWHKDNMYDNLPESLRAYESRSSEMIMGITPHGPFPTQSYWPNDLAGKDDEAGKYILRHIEDGAEWVGEYFDQFFRKDGESSGVLMPKYWEVINEPDMDVNVGRTFVMSSFEQIFEYHNLVANELRSRFPEGQRPLVGGMTWGLHDLDKPDLSERFATQQNAVRSRYAYEAGELEDFLQDVTESVHWDVRKNDFYQWDYLWKGFMDAAGDNMDFYSIHLYDWAPMGDNPKNGTFRRGMTTEAVLDMVEWYDAQVNGKENLKPWVISEYGAITAQHSNVAFLSNDYRYADWLHVRTFNQMFMQLLTRPSQIVKSMPFAPVKATWGAGVTADGTVVRYEPSLLQTDEPKSPAFFSEEAQWYVTDKIQWYELWADVKGTRVDTHSSDPDIQVDAYVDGNHTYLILNNLEWYDIPVDLAFLGANSNSVNSVKMKHSYLAEGLSPVNLGRGVLAQAVLDKLPESVTLQPGSTIVLDIEYNDDIQISELSKEDKYYSESLSGAGKGQAAKGQVHRVHANAVTAHVNGVNVPVQGEATLRIAAKMYPFHASNVRADLNNFTINGHTLNVPREVNPNTAGVPTEHLDFMGPEVDANGVALNLIEIPIPLEYLQEDNTIEARINLAQAFTAVSISVWDMSKAATRTDANVCAPCDAVSSLSITGASSVNIKESIALTADVLPLTAGNKAVKWTTSNVAIAAVDQNGLVTGTGSGTATIRGTTLDGSYVAEHQVTVVTIQLSSVDISNADANLAVNETLQLNVSTEPFNATNKKLNWVSSNPAVATVSSGGLVTALSDGNTTITASAVDGGASDSVNISVVSQSLTDLDVPSTGVIVLPGSYQVPLSFTPANATNLAVTWRSANTNIASVNASGLVTGVSAGTTTITATAADGGLTASIIVSVLNEGGITDTGFVVEAETLSNTGGPYGGFSVSATGINNNQSGDWAEYNVNFAQEGVYRLILDAGTPTAPSNGVTVYINGQSAGTAELPTTGDWDVMQSTVVTNSLLVPSEGLHTIRIESVGAEAKWQWNADKMRFVLLSALTPPTDPDGPSDPTDPTDPTDPVDPVAASLVLDDASKYRNTTYQVGGNIVVSANYHAGTGQKVTLNQGGVKFFLREMTSDWSQVVNDVLAFDASAIGQESGSASATLSLAGLTPTADLPNGNFYFLFAIFNSSDGTDYKIPGVFPINIVAESTDPVDPVDPVDASFALDDDNKYRNATYEVGSSISVSANYHAGGDQTVTNQHGGIKFLLREMTSDWSTIVKDVVAYDASAIAQTEGTASATLSLADVTPTADLPNGNFYYLYAVFNSTDGTDYSIPGVFPINIVAAPVDPVDPVNPGDATDGAAFTIEAEAFDATGGDFSPAGVIIGERGIPTDRHTVIDSVQTTDWVDYVINFPTSDFYRIEMLASGAELLANASLFVDGNFVQETPIYTTSQAIFETFELTEGTYITAGTHTIRVQATSSKRAWMWFGDSFTFTQLIFAEEAVAGDWDEDGDVDADDIRAMTLAIQKRQAIDISFDFNKDGVVNVLDTRVLMTMCTRARCAI